MDAPKRVKCEICGKDYAMNWIDRHRRDAHGPNSEKKKKAVKAVKKEVKSTGPEDAKPRNYKIPPGQEMTDEQLAKFFDGVEIIDSTDNSETGLQAMSISYENNNNAIVVADPVKTKTKTRNQPEQAIQKKMEKKLGYGHKTVPYGVIDILTNHEIVEIKHWDGWIKAIGQCIVYGHMYPNHMKWIHFFGDLPPMDKQIYIKAVCARLSIKVTHE